KFVRTIVDDSGMAVFNKVWGGPQTLPTMDELSDPQAWLDRVGHGHGAIAGASWDSHPGAGANGADVNGAEGNRADVNGADPNASGGQTASGQASGGQASDGQAAGGQAAGGQAGGGQAGGGNGA